MWWAVPIIAQAAPSCDKTPIPSQGHACPPISLFPLEFPCSLQPKECPFLLPALVQYSFLFSKAWELPRLPVCILLRTPYWKAFLLNEMGQWSACSRVLWPIFRPPHPINAAPWEWHNSGWLGFHTVVSVQQHLGNPQTVMNIWRLLKQRTCLRTSYLAYCVLWNYMIWIDPITDHFQGNKCSASLPCPSPLSTFYCWESPNLPVERSRSSLWES